MSLFFLLVKPTYISILSFSNNNPRASIFSSSPSSSFTVSSSSIDSSTSFTVSYLTIDLVWVLLTWISTLGMRGQDWEDLRACDVFASLAIGKSLNFISLDQTSRCKTYVNCWLYIFNRATLYCLCCIMLSSNPSNLT